MRAVAVHTFAGGFLLGVRQAGFQVSTAFEPLGFGCSTLRGLNVHVPGTGEMWYNWRVPPYPVDLVFGNPRCGGFGSLGSNIGDDNTRGAVCQQSSDYRQLCCFAVKVRPRVIIIESVQALYTGCARSFLDRMVKILHEAGYSVGHVFFNAAFLGSPQFRRRYFLVAWRRGSKKVPFYVYKPPLLPHRATTVWDCIGDLQDRDAHGMNVCVKSAVYDEDTYHLTTHDDGSNGENFRCIGILDEGQGLNNLHHKYGPKIFKKLGCPNFYERSLHARSSIPFSAVNNVQRLYAHGQCPVMTGTSSMFVHPYIDRTLTVRELCRLMGWPDSVTPRGKDPARQLALGVIPAAGEWIAKQARYFIRDKHVYDRDGKIAMDKMNDGDLLNYNKLIPPKAGTVREPFKRSSEK